MCIVLTHKENSINDEYFHYYLHYRYFVFSQFSAFAELANFLPILRMPSPTAYHIFGTSILLTIAAVFLTCE